MEIHIRQIERAHPTFAFSATMINSKPALYTALSPALLHLYDVNHAIVVIIDVLRATSTIATALHNGAKCVIPVDSVAKCIELGRQIDGITAGERDGMIAEGLEHGNSPFEYPRSFIAGKTLVLTTTNGTKLLHMALDQRGRPDHHRLLLQSRFGLQLPDRSEPAGRTGLRGLEGQGQYRRPAFSRGPSSTR